MTTWAMLKLVFYWSLSSCLWLVFLVCVLCGMVIQSILLHRCKGFVRWVFPAVTGVIWLAMEITGWFVASFVQFIVLWVLGAAMAACLGALLGTALYGTDQGGSGAK